MAYSLLFRSKISEFNAEYIYGSWKGSIRNMKTIPNFGYAALKWGPTIDTAEGCDTGVAKRRGCSEFSG